MKKFFCGIFIEQEVLRKEGIYHPVKVEYYKNIEENQKENKSKYGIEVIKTEYYQHIVKVEKDKITGITNDEKTIEKILEIFKENRVTPIGMKDVMMEISTKYLQII